MRLEPGAAFRGEAASGVETNHSYTFLHPLLPIRTLFFIIMTCYYVIITSLLRHYYVIISNLLHHYYSNKGAIITVIMGLLLPIITKSIMGNNESIITHYEPTQLADVKE